MILIGTDAHIITIGVVACVVIFFIAAGRVVIVLLLAIQLVVDHQMQNFVVMTMDHALRVLLLSMRLYMLASLSKAKFTGFVHRLLESILLSACNHRHTSPVAVMVTCVFSKTLKLLMVNSCGSLLSTNRLLALAWTSVTSTNSLSLAAIAGEGFCSALALSASSFCCTAAQ